MRKFVTKLCFLLCLINPIFSQNNYSNPIVLSQLPREGILLDKGWKFHAGDNPEWAQADFDDSNWQSINPTLEVYDSLPQLQRNIGWFRLHLVVDTTLNQSLVLRIHQSGASEI